MPTIAYAMADMAPSRDGHVHAGAVTVAGGCGVCHEITVDAELRPYVACDICAPILTGSHYGWASTPHGVPLTPDEHAQRELAKRDAEAGQNALMSAMVGDFMSRLGTPATTAAITAPAAEPTVADVLSKASPEELLAAMPEEMRAALEAAVSAKVLAAKDPAPVKPAQARTPRTPRSGTTRR